MTGTSTIAPAREVAYEVLKAVENGAFASDELRKRSSHLESRDAGLAAQIVFGSLRYQGQLDFLATKYSGHPLDKIDGEVKVPLRAAIFQLRYLERVPAHAVVDDSVEYVKRRRKAAAGFANAILRKVKRDAVAWPDEATVLSCPDWVLKRWIRQFGPQTAKKVAEAALQEPASYIRSPQGIPLGMEGEATELPGCFRLHSAPRGLRLHDLGSQSIVPLLGLESGHSFLDVCAAPGNKTIQALETPLRLAVAGDISIERLRQIPEICPRVLLDASQPLPFAPAFDRILVDAPCSGTGTLARNPEIKWRLKDYDFPRFRERQIQIVSRAARVLAPGGKLVYSTCSLEREENEEVVNALLNASSGLRCERQVRRFPGQDEGDGFFAAVLVKV